MSLTTNTMDIIKKQVSDIYTTEKSKLSNYRDRYCKISSNNNKCIIKRDDDIRDSDLELLELSRYIFELERNMQILELLNDVISSDIRSSSKLQFINLLKSHNNIHTFTQRYPKLVENCEETLKYQCIYLFQNSE